MQNLFQFLLHKKKHKMKTVTEKVFVAFSIIALFAQYSLLCDRKNVECVQQTVISVVEQSLESSQLRNDESSVWKDVSGGAAHKQGEALMAALEFSCTDDCKRKCNVVCRWLLCWLCTFHDHIPLLVSLIHFVSLPMCRETVDKWRSF